MSNHFSSPLFFKYSMSKFSSRIWLLPIMSAVLTYFNICKVDFFFSWICYIPLFIFILYSSPKQSFKTGALFGFAFSIPCFFWIIPGAERFTGHSIAYGIAVFFLFVVFFSIFFGVILYIFSLISSLLRHQYFQ